MAVLGTMLIACMILICAAVCVGAIRWDKFTPDDDPVIIFDPAETKQEKDPLRENNDLIEDLFWLRIKE